MPHHGHSHGPNSECLGWINFVLLILVLFVMFDFRSETNIAQLDLATCPVCANGDKQDYSNIHPESCGSVIFLSGFVVLLTACVGFWLLSRKRNISSDGPYHCGQVGVPNNGHVSFVCERLSSSVQIDRSRQFFNLMNIRRSVRFFSPDPVPLEVLLNCVKTAGTSPSGAHQQPWMFVTVTDFEIRKKIRALVEQEERFNYEKKMKKTWIDDVSTILSDLHETQSPESILKPYLTEAPVLVLVFKKTFEYVTSPSGELERKPIHYPMHSVGIATGLFLAALTNAGLCTLTSTPMGAESEIARLIGRPANEKLFLLMPVGFPSPTATVPFRTKDTLRLPEEKIYQVV